MPSIGPSFLRDPLAPATSIPIVISAIPIKIRQYETELKLIRTPLIPSRNGVQILTCHAHDDAHDKTVYSLHEITVIQTEEHRADHDRYDQGETPFHAAVNDGTKQKFLNKR